MRKREVEDVQGITERRRVYRQKLKDMKKADEEDETVVEGGVFVHLDHLQQMRQKVAVQREAIRLAERNTERQRRGLPKLETRKRTRLGDIGMTDVDDLMSMDVNSGAGVFTDVATLVKEEAAKSGAAAAKSLDWSKSDSTEKTTEWNEDEDWSNAGQDWSEDSEKVETGTDESGGENKKEWSMS